ncbi:UNVERIFIED_CONTAM: hypothetical protein FKN15_018038 [Acipenser sinensis]
MHDCGRVPCSVRQLSFRQLAHFILEGQAEGTTERYLIGSAILQGPPLSHSERGKANTPFSPLLRVIAMTDRQIYEAAAPSCSTTHAPDSQHRPPLLQ